VVESFAAEADEHHHMSTPHLAHYGPKIADCVEGTWVREYLDPFEV
jgi:quinol monooxygenase YgiN